MMPLLIAALLVRLFFVFVGPFFIRPDEVFQALEPAHRLVSGYGVITWEWQQAIRSWLLPGVIALIMQASASAGLGYSILVVQSVFSVLSLGVVATAILFGDVFAGRAGALFCGVLTAFWPDTVLYGSHTLSETQGGNLLAVGAMLASMMLKRRQASAPAVLGIGVLFGLAIILRFQLVPAVAVVLVAALLADWRRFGLILLLGSALPVAAQALLDALTLGSPLQSMWKNLRINFDQGNADLFGTMSPVFYFTQMVQFWGAASLPLAICFAAGLRKAMLPGLVILAVVGSHSLIGHKEFSFIYGALPLVLVVAGVGAARLLDRHRRQRPATGMQRWVAAIMVSVCVMTMFSGYKPMRRDHVRFATLVRQARSAPGLCGLGLYGDADAWWAWTGGYSLLDRKVPLYLLRTPADFANAEPGFNALIADRAVLNYLPSNYLITDCIRSVCLLRRMTPCAPTQYRSMRAEPELGLPSRKR